MLEDKVCIVAGSGHGIGEKTAIELGRQGAKVVVNDLGADVHGEGASDEPAKTTAEAVREEGGEALAHFGDVTSLDYIEELIEDTIEEYGRLDGVVNFAGILRDSLSYKMDEDEWDTVIHVHLKGHFSLLRNAGAHWRTTAKEEGIETQRSFVGVSSRSALGNVGQLNYSAAKAGILGMVRSAASELARSNVRVNALMPVAYTRMIERIPEEHRQVDPEKYPPEKVAPMVGYLMSDAAEGVTGCTLLAEGDTIGLVSNPKSEHRAYNPEGWTTEEIADQFKSTITQGVDLDNSEPGF
jgi:3-oxoacyl-[acyl-carrier protein] reductase